MLYLAKFDSMGDVLLAAPDGDRALALLVEHGIAATPTQLREVPDELFCCEVCWADPEGDEEADETNPANLSSEGVVLEPLEAFADFLEIEARAEVTSGASATPT